LQLFLAFLLFAAAFFAEPIFEHFPAISTDVRSVMDDFGAGDPKKIIHYRQATATIMEHGYDSAKVKYPMDGYIMATGITARNAEERSLLKRLPNGSSLVVFYDPVNPTIVVMQPTYNLAQSKMRLVNIPKGGYGERKGKKHFIAGYGVTERINYFRIGCIVIGFALLFSGAQALKSDHQI
jgi:hypothetical protein